jgi:hypothetical protein
MIVFGIKYCDQCNDPIFHGERFDAMRKSDVTPISGPIECLHFHDDERRQCFTAYLEEKLDAHAIETVHLGGELETRRHS